MAQYKYQGKDRQGNLVSGEIEASSENNAMELLLSRAIMPIEVTAAAKELEINWQQLFKPQMVSLEELQIFTRQMYSLTRSGIPMLRAMMGLAETAHSLRLREALVDISEQLTAGRPLSAAMHSHSDIFDTLFISMVHVGENTGKLEDAFYQLSVYIEREQETRRRIKSAMRYPVMVILFVAGALVVLNIFVIPQFASLFARFGADLPLPTRILMTSSNLFVNYWHLMLATILAVFFGVKHWLKTPGGQRSWGEKKLKLPIVGSIIERSTLARYCRSFGMMISAGVPMTQALTLTAEAVDNAFMHDKILAMRHSIEGGESLLRVSSNSQLFTPLVLQMVSVGEETGQIEQLLSDAADFYEGEVDYDLKNLTAKIEPLLIGFVSAIVMLLALGIYLPMWEMLSIIKN